MTYEQFMLDLWRELKRTAEEPVFSVGDVILVIATLAFKPPWWVVVPLFFVWLIWREHRPSIGTGTRRD